MIPINLRELYGKRCKIGLDEAAQYESGGRNDPWLFQIPCKFGHIYPISDKFLGFWCEGIRVRARLRREHPEIEEIQEGDLESVFQFTRDQFDIVAEYAKPRRRRRLSEKQRKIQIERLKGYQFKAQIAAVDSPPGSQESPNGKPVV